MKTTDIALLVWLGFFTQLLFIGEEKTMSTDLSAGKCSRLVLLYWLMLP